MNKLEYEIDGERHELQLPESFAEMTGEQLVAAVRLMDGDDGDPLRIVCGMPEDAFAALSDFQRFMIMDSFGWLDHLDMSSLSFKGWKIPSIDVDGEVWYGPTSNFGNITWGEFVYADQCMIQGFHRAAVAALFRPQRKDYDGETDRRIPFTIYGTTGRFGKLSVMDEALQVAILLNYRAMRAASLESVYTEIFPYHDLSTSDDDGPNDNPPEPEEQPSQFSWTNIHRNLLGDNIQDEEKFLQLPVHTVLYRLNTLIQESKKRKNNG